MAQLLIFKEKSLPIERKLKFYQTDSDEKPVFAYFQSSHQFEDAFYSDLDFKIKQKGELMISGLIKKILDPDNKYPECNSIFSFFSKKMMNFLFSIFIQYVS